MVATPPRERVYERLVAWIWDRQAHLGSLPADDGHTYDVVFRGRPWGEARRPDFQGAILARDDGLLLRGDVEIHVRASDWHRHQHGQDPAYNGAICQVVLWQDEPPPVHRQDGQPLPTLELITRLASSLAELEQQAARERSSGAVPLPMACAEPDLAGLLERAGLVRFHEHAAAFEGDLACEPPAEVLYRGTLRAMGYTANTAGFERLGVVLPLEALRSLAPAPGPRHLPLLQAALLGVAGLLPSQRSMQPDAEWPRVLEAAWSEVSQQLPAALPPGTWRGWRVRPDNAPVRRAAGFAEIVSGWGSGDPIDRLLEDLSEPVGAPIPAMLAARWQSRVPEGSFWATYHDFGRPLPSPQRWLVGAGRAAEVVINVVLPFAYALGQASGDAVLSERALDVYRRYPSGPPNRVVREMALQVGGTAGSRLAKGACRQQGLIHLYRHWCDTRDCAHCLVRTSQDAAHPAAHP